MYEWYGYDMNEWCYDMNKYMIVYMDMMCVYSMNMICVWIWYMIYDVCINKCINYMDMIWIWCGCDDQWINKWWYMDIE